MCDSTNSEKEPLMQATRRGKDCEHHQRFGCGSICFPEGEDSESEGFDPFLACESYAVGKIQMDFAQTRKWRSRKMFSCPTVSSAVQVQRVKKLCAHSSICKSLHLPY